MKFLFLSLALILFTPSSAYALERPSVVVSIKPIALIAEDLLDGAVRVETLLQGTVSPHDYQMRPSDLTRLHRAGGVIWVGPSLETFLQKPIAGLDKQAVLTLLPEEEPGHHDHAGEHHHHEGEDPHLWLSPTEAKGVTEQIARFLVKRYPSVAGRVEQNRDELLAGLDSLDSELKVLFSGSNRSYLVQHDGYSHFEERYGLSHAAVYSPTPERSPGAKHLWHLQRLIDNGSIGCVLSEPQLHRKSLDRLVAGRDLGVVELDPLAVRYMPKDGEFSFVRFLRGFAESFARCVVSEER